MKEKILKKITMKPITKEKINFNIDLINIQKIINNMMKINIFILTKKLKKKIQQLILIAKIKKKL